MCFFILRYFKAGAKITLNFHSCNIYTQKKRDNILPRPVSRNYNLMKSFERMEPAPPLKPAPVQIRHFVDKDRLFFKYSNSPQRISSPFQPSIQNPGHSTRDPVVFAWYAPAPRCGRFLAALPRLFCTATLP